MKTVRLETELKEETFTFITRDFHRNTFLECLNGILSKQTGAQLFKRQVKLTFG